MTGPTTDKPTPDEILKHHFHTQVTFDEADLAMLRDVIKLRFDQGAAQGGLRPFMVFELAANSMVVVENVFAKNFAKAVEEIKRTHPEPSKLALPPGAGTLLVPPGAR